MKPKRKLIAINGESWCRNITGIERVAIETTIFLDKFLRPGQAELVVPKNARNLPDLKNIKIVTLDYEMGNFTVWMQVHFQRYVKKRHALSLDFGNTCPFFAPGLEFIHDIYCALYPEDFRNRRDRLVRLYSCLMYWRIAKKAKKIFTVSEYTKKTIIDRYGTKPEKIHVVYSGVSNYSEVKEDNSVFDSLPQIEGKQFYFMLGSLSTRKNLKWIADHAELYPNELFVVSGKPLDSVVPPELEKIRNLSNVVFAGYLSDGQVKALMKRCRAFIMPSYFEGFGMPPLEALSCGTKIIISNRTSLPEIYGDTAYYIDPDTPDTDLDKLMEKPVADPAPCLEKFTFQKTAERIYEQLKEYLLEAN